MILKPRGAGAQVATHSHLPRVWREAGMDGRRSEKAKVPEDGGLIGQALIGLKPVNAWVHTYTKPQTSSTRSRSLGWRIHESVEDTKLSTNKQHSLSPKPGKTCGPPRCFPRVAKHSRRGREGFPAEKTDTGTQNLSLVFRGPPPGIRRFASKNGQILRAPPPLSEGRKTLTPRA